MTPQIALTLGVTLGALALFTWNRLRVEVVGLVVMASLIVLGLVTPQQGISGFASEATVTVALMLVLSTGLLRTGAVDVLGRWASRAAGKTELGLLLVIIAVVVPLSAVINNTAAVAILLPVVLGLSRDRQVAPSRVLMPLSFAGQMGGTLTLIGTSTNLLVAGLVLEAGIVRLSLFDITPPAAILTVLGVAYLLTVGRRLTPARQSGEGLLEVYELREYLTALVVGDDSRLAGRTLAETRFGDAYGLQVAEIHRAGARIVAPSGAAVIHASDVLVVTGKIPDIARIAEVEHLSIAGSRPELAAPDADRDDPREAPTLAELLVPPRSHAVGRTLRDLEFRTRYGAAVLGLQRHANPVHAPLATVPLQAGDLLLVEGTADTLRALRDDGDFAFLGPVRVPAKRRRKLRRSVAIMAGVVALPALGVTTILVSALLGVVAMLLTGCITTREAYDELEWPVIVLLGSILPLGHAMRDTGAAAWVAEGLIGVIAPLGPYGTLAAIYLVTSALTEMISNNAAAVVLVPVAIATAETLGISPLPLVIAVMLAASNSFVTPIGYQTNTFIFGPGGYRFADFVRVGGPLNLILVIAATLAIPIFFPF